MQASGNALLPHLFQYTVTVVDTKRLPESQFLEWGFFSGTLVSIASRLFIATASHCLDNEGCPDRYRVVADDGRLSDEGSAALITIRGTSGHRPDVGLIELDSDSYSTFCPKPAIPISRITTDNIENRLAMLMGTPAESVKILTDRMSAVASGYNSSPIDEAEWPRINPEKHDLDKTIDMLMRYPNHSPDIRDETGIHTDLPDPRGMSGGGLWDHGLATSHVWSVEDSRLAGIQSAWFPKRGYVRIVRVMHWLALVRQHYPSLRPQIESHFPELVTAD